MIKFDLENKKIKIDHWILLSNITESTHQIYNHVSTSSKIQLFHEVLRPYSFILYATTPSSLYTSGSEGQIAFACMINWKTMPLSEFLSCQKIIISEDIKKKYLKCGRKIEMIIAGAKQNSTHYSNITTPKQRKWPTKLQITFLLSSCRSTYWLHCNQTMTSLVLQN